MKITLQTLIGADACISAQKEFVNTFGDDGSVTPKQLFKAIAKLGRKDWLWWSALHISGFAEAIGNYKSGNFYLAISGEVQVVGAFVLAFNNSTVEAFDNSTVKAFDNSTVEALDRLSSSANTPFTSRVNLSSFPMPIQSLTPGKIWSVSGLKWHREPVGVDEEQPKRQKK